MKTRNPILALVLASAFSVALHFQSMAQTTGSPAPTPVAASASTPVPSLVPYSGVAVAADGKALTGEAGITSQIYKDEVGGEALWTETQTVAVDPTGHYQVQLGATNPNGLPSDLFATGEARWLEVQIAGQSPQPRILIASVPYALKAGDATTLGGLPASAFALAGSRNLAATAGPSAITANGITDVTTTGGTANNLAKFSGASTIVDSILFDTGTEIGIGTSFPAATLDVRGTTNLHGIASLYNLTTANTSAGSNSYGLEFLASVFDSSTKAAVKPYFELRAEPADNDTATPRATLNLLSSSGVAGIMETGFYFNANGTMNFAPGQTFPGSALTGVVNASSYDLGGASFATGSTSGGTAYLGFAGKTGSSGTSNTGIGYKALSSDSTGSDNTAIGRDALVYNTSGSSNTGLGYLAGPDSGSPSLSNSTALGANATVSESNALVLGGTTAGEPGASHVNVGIGTATPRSILEAAVSASSALGPALTLTNTAGGLDAAASIDFNTYYHPSVPYNNPTTRIEAVDDNNYGNNLLFLSKKDGADSNGLQTNMEIFSTGGVIAYGQTLGNDSGTDGLEGVAGNGAGSLSGGNGGLFLGGSAAGSGDGGNGVYGVGGNSISGVNGGSGGYFEGGSSGVQGGYGGYLEGGSGERGGAGGYFLGGNGSLDDQGGDGIEAYPGQDGEGNYAWAAALEGDVIVAGTLSASAKDFKIDHPSDPANKYLVHTSVESSEMVNIYSGNVVTDELGLATIQLPDWFEAENADFRYQLTTIGRQAQAWIAEEVGNKQFKIATNASHVKVSWQITGVRQDAYAKTHPLVVEQEKPARERGYYIHPELYGQPAEKQTEWGRHPQQMQHMKQVREQQRLQTQPHPGLGSPSPVSPAAK